MHIYMRIKTDGKYEYREDVFDRAADVFDENTTTGGVEKACLHATQDRDGKAEALDYLANELPPRKLQRVAEMLSTDYLELDVEVNQQVKTPDG
jgi:hypothetical protein